MKIYLVGGAVRDQLLGLAIKDKDYLVVGATPAELLALGYQSVGKDFPVFLHPRTKAEYALARTERKQGQGYTGFACYFAPDVTVEQDLQRRDLTINAMALDESDGGIVDPFGGQQDLAHKLLRHVSSAFVEDPLRVLRVARFYARFYPLGFTVADETMLLLRQLVTSGELVHLTAERVWQETAKALQEPTPAAYLLLLQQIGAFPTLLPEFSTDKTITDISQPLYSLSAVHYAAQLSPRLDVRFAVVCQYLALAPLQQLCQRLRVPNDCKDLAVLACQYVSWLMRADRLSAQELQTLFDSIDLWRKPERLPLLLCCAQAAQLAADRHPLGCQNDSLPMTVTAESAHSPLPQAAYLTAIATAARAVDIKSLVAQGFQGEAMRSAVAKARLTAIDDTKRQWQL